MTGIIDRVTQGPSLPLSPTLPPFPPTPQTNLPSFLFLHTVNVLWFCPKQNQSCSNAPSLHLLLQLCCLCSQCRQPGWLGKVNTTADQSFKLRCLNFMKLSAEMSDIIKLFFKIPVKAWLTFKASGTFRDVFWKVPNTWISECNLPPSTYLKALTQILGKLLSWAVLLLLFLI